MEEPQKPETIQRELAETGIVAGKTTERGTILRPQPTNDPNEPLVSRPPFLQPVEFPKRSMNSL